MKFFEKYGNPSKVKGSAKPLSTQEMLLHNLEQQRRLLQGLQVLGAGKKPIRSWFNKDVFSPKVGLFSLFDNHSITVQAGKEQEMLADFAVALKAGEFDGYIKEVDYKRNKKKNK